LASTKWLGKEFIRPTKLSWVRQDQFSKRAQGKIKKTKTRASLNQFRAQEKRKRNEGFPKSDESTRKKKKKKTRAFLDQEATSSHLVTRKRERAREKERERCGIIDLVQARGYVRVLDGYVMGLRKEAQQLIKLCMYVSMYVVSTQRT
jgi:hypothetical protein